MSATPDAARGHPLAAWLRERVLGLRATTRRRNFPGAVELVPVDASPGTPAVAGWVYGYEGTDHALRVDVLVGLLTDCRRRGVSRVSVVHVRPGRHDPTDLDLGWAAAARAAGEVSGVQVPNVLVVSRWGWCDLFDGTERSWVRPRPRPTGRTADPAADPAADPTAND